jgi:hypothetical protein
MFDLEAAVNAWRREFKNACPQAAAEIDELEDHLREDYAALVRAGRAPADAWALAQSRLGAPSLLASEFARSARLSALDRGVFTLVPTLCAVALIAVTAVVCTRAPQAVAGRVLAGHILTITFGYVAGLAAAILAAYVALKAIVARQPLPRLTAVGLRSVRIASLVAAVFTIVGFALGAAWLNAAQGRPFDGDPRELGAVAVAVCFLAALAAASRRATSSSLILALAIAGGGVVLAAWFAARPEQAGGRPLFQAIGLGGLAASLVLAAVALKAPRDATASI